MTDLEQVKLGDAFTRLAQGTMTSDVSYDLKGSEDSLTIRLEQGWEINFLKGPHEKCGRLQRAGPIHLTQFCPIYFISLYKWNITIIQKCGAHNYTSS